MSVAHQQETPTHTGSGADAPGHTLSLGDAITMIVGLIVGAGIFGTPAIVAGAVQSEAMLVAVWIAGGLFSIIGALCYAELATAFPSAGGEYHFIYKATTCRGSSAWAGIRRRCGRRSSSSR
jgi:amino acid transporter